jgi:hypothetical protein
MRTTRHAYLAAMLALAPVTNAMAASSGDVHILTEAHYIYGRNAADIGPQGTRDAIGSSPLAGKAGGRGIVRPDIHLENSHDIAAYDGGRKDYQASANVDAIWHH